MRQRLAIALLIAVLTSVPGYLPGQGIYWNNTYDFGGDYEGQGRIKIVDSAIFLLHNYDTKDSVRIRTGLSKFNLDGTILWTKEYSEPGYHYRSDRNFCATDSFLCFYISQLNSEPYSNAGLLVKTDLEGDTVLYRKLVYNRPHRFIASEVLSDGSVVMTGYVKVDSNNYHWVFKKLDPLGDEIWYREYPWNSGYTYSNDGSDIELALDGGFILGGWSDGYDSSKSIQGMVIKTDPLGYIEWIKDYGEKWYDTRFSVATVDSFVYVSGKVNVQGNDLYPWEGKLEAFIGKYRLDGTPIFEKYFGPPTGPFGFITDAYPLRNGEILAYGSHPDLSQFRSGLLFRLTNNGDSVWSRYHDYLFGLKNTHIIQSVAELPDGSIITAGQMVPHPKHWDSIAPAIWMMRVDSMGCHFPGCDTVCIRPTVKYEIEILPELEVKVINTTQNALISRMLLEEPGIGYTTSDSFEVVRKMTKPGSLRVQINLEGPCNIPIFWDTMIQVDYVGQFTLEGKEILINLYPNPATNYLNLQWQGGTPAGTVSLYDLQGRELLQQAVLEASTQMDVSRLAAALYLAIIRDEQGRVIWRKKVVVE